MHPITESREAETLLDSWWECQMLQPVWKTVLQFLKKLNKKPSHDPAVLLLGIYTEDLKVGTQIDIYIPIGIAALFTEPEGRNNLYPSIDRRINTM